MIFRAGRPHHRIDLIVVRSIGNAAHSSTKSSTHGAQSECGREMLLASITGLDAAARAILPLRDLTGRIPGISRAGIRNTAESLALSSIGLARHLPVAESRADKADRSADGPFGHEPGPLAYGQR
jgi:hypothetical protein